ncbi:uracil-DNA glycosylase family protein [Natrarchaeobaculum aegyptiacum]|uniref:Uracil-DNA glycosylase n=1 Tax=Natrarchaeobaculum aegyptiacum TaxID=745377 RepID=A0A2Z2HVC7_9EURY|nr:uracil-DNA glycosylase family protein [Natrarchaeobaculum aegyptiacum]ARS91161.1 uracil-DNA glycosylase [Natrarchaeobaculum aegyptiacum]
MKTVTDRTSNPFDLEPPCDCSPPDERQAVFSYGDANADFHVIGDHPGVHGGKRTGVPFTETDAGRGVVDVLRSTGFVSGPDDAPTVENAFLSYLHMCTLPNGHEPAVAAYDALEPFFDAELRAINAHILLPVGERATDHVLEGYTTQRDKVDLDMARLHAQEIRGRGFLVVPIRDPSSWEPGDREKIRSRLEAILGRDYRQTKGVATTVG